MPEESIASSLVHKPKNVLPKPSVNSPVEIEQHRTSHTKTYINPDGSFTVETSYRPIHYKNERGRWAKIDNELVSANPWAGFKYFRMAFENDGFWLALKNTLIISSMKLVFNFPAPIILAILLNEVRNLRFKKVVQTITYMPHFISWVVLAGIVINFLSPSTGAVNMVLKSLGIDPIYFVGNKSWFRSVLISTAM